MPQSGATVLQAGCTAPSTQYTLMSPTQKRRIRLRNISINLCRNAIIDGQTVTPEPKGLDEGLNRPNEGPDGPNNRLTKDQKGVLTNRPIWSTSQAQWGWLCHPSFDCGQSACRFTTFTCEIQATCWSLHSVQNLVYGQIPGEGSAREVQNNLDRIRE